MTEQQILTAGYIAAKRFLGDFPGWFEIVRACAIVAERTKGEFAGAWTLQEAKKSGIEWFPNLRPLVSYSILRRTDVARGGRRAYYEMLDVVGVKTALEEIGHEINNAATEAFANAMCRFTFGIVGDARGGAVGRGLGTGIGVCWRGSYLIITAGHVVEQTPYDRMYFFLPPDAIQMKNSRIPVNEPCGTMTPRFTLESPQVVLDDDSDIAAIILEEQRDERGKQHFYDLDTDHATLSPTSQVGFLGYPEATKLPIGQNFMATPYLDFGEKVDGAQGVDEDSQIAVKYPPVNTIEPYGLSGSGLWISAPFSKKVWAPGVSLAGLITNYDRKLNALIGYNVEKLIEFVRGLGTKFTAGVEVQHS